MMSLGDKTRRWRTPTSLLKDMAHMLLATALVGWLASAHAFVFTVDTVTDTTDMKPGDGLCQDASGQCSLRAAIQEANAWPGDDTILLSAATYSLTIAPVTTDTDANGDLDILEDLTISGHGQIQTTIDATGLGSRVFDVDLGSTVMITDMALSHGTDFNGGGIRNNGDLTLRDVAIKNNTAGLNGGGIYQGGAGSRLDLTRVEIDNNSADTSGGGLALQQGSATLRFCHIGSNQAQQSGGGLTINGGVTAVIEDSIIELNQTLATSTGLGGGISSFGDLTLERSTLNNNSTMFFGGGLYANGPTTTQTNPAMLHIVNSTIYGNRVDQGTGSGGGLYVALQQKRVATTNPANPFQLVDAAVLEHVTMTGNKVDKIAPQEDNLAVDLQTVGQDQGFVTVKDSIVATQTAGRPSCSGPVSHIHSGGYNVFDDVNACPVDTSQGDTLVSDAGQILASTTLNNNIGGPTPGLRPKAGTNATTTRCPETDQRGFPIAPGSPCDIGAIARLPAGTVAADLAIVSIVPTPTTVQVAAANSGNLHYDITVANNGPDKTNGTVILKHRILPPDGNAKSQNGQALLDNVPINCPYDAINTVNSCDLGVMNPGDTKVVTITTDTALSGEIRETAVSLDDTGTSPTTDPNHSNDRNISATATAYENSDVTLTIETLDDSGTATTNVVAGTPFKYRLTVSTIGTANDVKLIDDLPAGMTLIRSIPSAGSCSATGQHLSCKLGDMADKTSATITLRIVANQRGQLTNRARINFLGTPVDATKLDQSTITTVQSQADLAVSAVTANTLAVVGADLSYIVTVENKGPSTATKPRLTIDLPAGLALRSTQSDAAWICDTSALPRISCTLPSLTASTSSSLTLFTTPQAEGTMTLAASAIQIATDGVDIDNDLSNNQLAADLTTQIIKPVEPIRGADLRLSILNALPTPARLGEKLSYSMTALNQGPDTAADVVLTIALPAGVDFDSASAGCAPNGQAVVCGLGQLASGTSASATIIVIPRQVATQHLTVSVSDNSGQDPDTSNNARALDTDVLPAMGTTQGTTGTGNGTTGLTKGSGACFIATAAYGSYLDPHVEALRRFRDEVLLPTATGRALVDFYYRHSPPLANFISRHEALRRLTRWLLTPLVLTVEYPGPGLGLLLALTSIGLGRRLRRPRQP